jgi:hypothetical protein
MLKQKIKFIFGSCGTEIHPEIVEIFIKRNSTHITDFAPINKFYALK